MATGGSAQPAAARSGGKIVTNNYRRRFNPYDRPPPPPAPPSRSPNWLSGLIVPASRTIASGAAKILSSVFNSDSSYSSSDSDADSVSEDDANIDNDHDIPSHEVNESNLEPETSLARMKCMSKEPGSSVEKCERKHVIEQLLMQEMFSREECDRLVTIIKSRVVEQSSIEMGENVVRTDTPGKTVDSVTPDLLDEAVMEAKKWFKERKVGQSPGSDFSRGVESEVGSPVDMAKSYMTARPLWASPSTEHIELRTPSTMITQLVREGKLHSVGHNSFSPSMKRSSLASGAWNIRDEIRRVRSKATEDMLQPSPSSKIDLSLFSLSPRTSQKYLVTDRVVARAGDNVNELNYLVETKPVDESADLGAGASTNLVLSALESRQGVVNEVQAKVPLQKQDSEAFQIDGEHAAPKSHDSASPDHAAEQHTDTNSGSRNGSTEKEGKVFAETQDANGLPSSQASLCAEGMVGENHRHSTEEIVSTLSHGNSSNGIPMEDRCEFLTETSVEVPIAYETEDVAIGYQNSYEELLQDQSQPEEKHDLAGNSDGTAMKQEGKKPSRNTRRSRGRGK